MTVCSPLLRACGLLLLALLPGSLPPSAVAQPADPAFEALMRQGISLHGRRDFDGAIRSYRQAQALAPNNVQVFHEISFSYFAKGDCVNSIDAAQQGLALTALPAAHAKLHMAVANCKDRLGDPQAALDSYARAVALAPQDNMVRFNLGITLARMQRIGPARESIETAVSIEPGHPSSHFVLSRLYEAQGQTGPALMAAIQFLALEPMGQRASAELQRIDLLFKKGVRRDPVTGKTTVNIDPKSLEREPQMAAMELAIAVAEANSQMAPSAGESRTEESRIERLTKVMDIFGEMGAKSQSDSFVAKTYLPLFAGLHSRGFSRAFSWYAHQSANLPGGREWVTANSAQFMQMQRWLQESRRPLLMPLQQ